jgi:hypothetical protein
LCLFADAAIGRILFPAHRFSPAERRMIRICKNIARLPQAEA